MLPPHTFLNVHVGLYDSTIHLCKEGGELLKPRVVLPSCLHHWFPGCCAGGYNYGVLYNYICSYLCFDLCSRVLAFDDQVLCILYDFITS